ncbi:NAD-binding protein [Vararia minispora EC-137]|uniref:NAD-binding protein n=1 Tax=Vararia minispora EC-137 TaxID=1314806 RepID=A0ACB8QAJ9_9AGAM|nr:NAD-binding protein [Vararia minispora EC-137]
MSGNGIKTIALAGVGSIGAFIAEELLTAKAAGALDGVIILTRAGGSNDAVGQYAAKGARVEHVDYADESALANALRGAAAVVSTLGAAAIVNEQLALARAAKTAGVQLFVPSDFGNNNEGQTRGLLGVKATLYAKIEELELAWATFYTGLFADFGFVPCVGGRPLLLGFDFENGVVTVGGDGSVPVSFTSRRDIARFVVHALTTFPLEQLRNKFLRIEASRKNFNEIVSIYEQKHGKKLEVRYTPAEELRARLEKNPLDFFALLHHEWIEGRGAVGSPVDNGKWPEWKPTPVDEFL